MDSLDGVILTAAHVLSAVDGIAWVAFPDAQERHRVKVIAGGSGTASQSHDLAILKFDPALKGFRSIEVQFDDINGEEEHRVTGFGRSNPEPVQAKALPSKTDDCTFTLRGQTLYGDSGSAVLTPEGHVDGIAVDGAESLGTNSMFEMKVLPLSCVAATVISVVSDIKNVEIMNAIWNGNDAVMRRNFQPPPGGEWVTNLRLAKALVNWAEMHSADKSKHASENKHLQDALRIIVERRLGYRILTDFAVATSTTKKAASDALQRLGDEERSSGSKKFAIAAYSGASTLYQQLLDDHSHEKTDIASEISKQAAVNAKKLAQLTVESRTIKASIPEAISVGYQQDIYDVESKKIGQIRDVLVGPDGRVKALIIGVGGFLGTGEKDVAVDFASVKRAQKNNKVFLTIDQNKDSLKAAPGFKYDANKAGWVPER